MLIGYEFEFLIQEGNKPLSKATFLKFHEQLAKQGWQPKFDAGTGELIGSEKDGLYITTDDAVCIMEINTPPHQTIQQCHEEMDNLLNYLQSIYGQLGCSIITTNAFPGHFETAEAVCRDVCHHSICCNKSAIRYVNVQRYGVNHDQLFYIAANHIWLDVDKEKALTALDVFNRLSGIFCSLFGNGPVANGKPLGVIEGRDILWHRMVDHSNIAYDKKIFGMFAKIPRSLIEYFDLIMDMPFYFSLRDGKAFTLVDKNKTFRDFFFSSTVSAQWFDKKPFETSPVLNDFFELQRMTFPSARLKFFIKPEIQLKDILSAYQQKDETALVNCFSKVCIEVRSVGAQPQSSISAGPAFALGLMVKLKEVESLLNQHDYNFWQEYYQQSVREGLLHPEILAQFLDLAREGLLERTEGEGRFLQILDERISRGINPGQEFLQAYLMQ